jgi:MFS family permease
MDVLTSSRIREADAKAASPTPAHWRRWSILVLLSLGAVIAFVDRTSIAAVIAAPSFRLHFGLSDLDRGTLASSFFWSYAALQIPMGWIVDRFGVKRPYTILFIVWCLASAGTGLMTSFSGLILMRLLTGVGESIVVPATYRWIKLNFDESNSGTVAGIYMLGTKIGPAIGAPLAAWLIVMHDWRAMFLITGLVGLIWLVPWMLLTTSDRAPTALVANEKSKNGARVRVSAILSSPMIWGTIILTFCYNYFVFYSMTWMPAYLVEQHGVSLRSSGIYSFFSFMGIAVVALAAGWVADMMIKRGMDAVIVRKSFTVAGFVLASTELVGGYAGSVHGAVFWNIVSLSGLGLATANNLALIRLTMIPAPAVGFVTGLQNVATSLAGIVTPILSGWLLQQTGSYDAPMKAIFVCLLVGAGSCILLVRSKWVPKIEDNRV